LGSSKLLALLNSLNRELGITMIFATHDVDIVPYLADRVLLMERGALRLSGTLAQAFRDADLLRRLSLRRPYIAQLAEFLVQDGLLPPGDPPLSVESAREMFGQMLRRRDERDAAVPSEFVAPEATRPVS
jgi:cobalt/nickel transport system ATP-binding protein